MATKNKVTIYFPDPDENELWDAIQSIPKGIRGVLLRDILRKSLLGAKPKIGLFFSEESDQEETEPEQGTGPEEPEADQEVLIEIPIF